MKKNIYTPGRIAHLILLYQQNKASEEQLKELNQWLCESSDNSKWFEKILHRTYHEENLATFGKFDSRKEWPNVQRKLKKPHRHILRHLLPYAALLIIGLAAWILTWQEQLQAPVQTPITATEIMPGSSRARLILDDGSAIELCTPEQGKGNVIAKENFITDGHTISYEDSTRQEKIQMHTLLIPPGGEYQLILADGTKVWLNAQTELRYPTCFSGNTREVELTGEAYFEVKKESGRPFYVRTSDMNIKVTGTSFNVRAYPNENRQATLVEGKISVCCRNREIDIKPGEQLTLTPDGPRVQTVNVSCYTEWRNQRFVFEDKLLEDIFRDLERWYDIRILIHNDEIRQIYFTGNLPKYENMDKMLEIIKLTTCVKYEINGRTVIIKAGR